MRRVALWAIALLVGAAPAPVAAFTISSHQRYVEAGVYDAVTSDTQDYEDLHAPDAGPFVAAVSALHAQTEGDAQQDSRIETDRIVASASATGSDVGGNSVALVISDLQISFDLAETTAFSLTGEAFIDNLDVVVSVDLRDSLGATLFSFTDADDPDDGQPQDFSVSGILEAGSYELLAAAGVCISESDNGICSGGEGSGTASYSFAFIVPEPQTGLLTGMALAMLAAIQRGVRRR